MKKLVLKTSLIAFAASLVFLLALFGIFSLAAPKVMMNFTESIGLTSLSGDYAYQEYERSGNLECLTRSFLIAADRKQDSKANTRFEALRADKNFEDYCAEVTGPALDSGPAYDFRDYLFAQAAGVKYRLAKTAEDKAAVIDFAVEATKESFPAGNPVIALASAAVGAGDRTFCGELAGRLETESKFVRSAQYDSFVEKLKELAAQ